MIAPIVKLVSEKSLRRSLADNQKISTVNAVARLGRASLGNTEDD
jgi:hypothetical protein